MLAKGDLGCLAYHHYTVPAVLRRKEMTLPAGAVMVVVVVVGPYCQFLSCSFVGQVGVAMSFQFYFLLWNEVEMSK